MGWWAHDLLASQPCCCSTQKGATAAHQPTRCSDDLARGLTKDEGRGGPAVGSGTHPPGRVPCRGRPPRSPPRTHTHSVSPIRAHGAIKQRQRQAFVFLCLINNARSHF